MDEIYKVALQQSYNLSISGGSPIPNYMISFGYYDQESNFVGQIMEGNTLIFALT